MVNDKESSWATQWLAVSWVFGFLAFAGTVAALSAALAGSGRAAGGETAFMLIPTIVVWGIVTALLSSKASYSFFGPTLVSGIVMGVVALAYNGAHLYVAWDYAWKCQHNESDLETAARVYACGKDEWVLWFVAAASLLWMVQLIIEVISLIGVYAKHGSPAETTRSGGTRAPTLNKYGGGGTWASQFRV